MTKEKIKIDTLFTNTQVVNVFTLEMVETDVAVIDGYFTGFSGRGKELYDPLEIVDLDGMYMVPGLIDAHVHIESAMVTPKNFARAVVPCGTTSCIADPHEIANVAGIAGIEYMIRSAGKTDMNILFALPSCVPATHMETAGAVLDADQLALLIDHPKIVALAEMMNYPGVIFKDRDVLEKIAMAQKALKPIDGHAPGVTGPDLFAYTGAGILSDHECTAADEAMEKLRLGMHIMVREGTCAKNLDDLYPAITDKTYNRMMWCTDDRHPEEILFQGHIDHIIRKAVNKGLDPLKAIAMGTINPAEYFNIRDAGAIAPGRRADFLAVRDLADFKAEKVFVKGKIPQSQENENAADYPSIMDVNRNDLDFSIPFAQKPYKKIRVIDIIPDQVVTRQIKISPKQENGFLVSDVERDILKIAVVDRYSGNAQTGKGFVKGFGLNKGAVASSVAHDSHNIIVVGATDEDMEKAVGKVIDMKGGFAVSEGGDIKACLELPVGGLMSQDPVEKVNQKMSELIQHVSLLGCPLKDPFMALGFLALPVIPELKITDQGLVDVNLFTIVDLNAGEN